MRRWSQDTEDTLRVHKVAVKSLGQAVMSNILQGTFAGVLHSEVLNLSDLPVGEQWLKACLPVWR